MFGRQLIFSHLMSLVRRSARGALFRKYVVLFATAIGLALVANNLVNVWFTYSEYRDDIVRFQKEQAAVAASKISQFIKEIEGQLGWMTHLSWGMPTADQRELDAQRLMRQVPAITELALLDERGREQLRFLRQAEDRVGSGIDYSMDDRFKLAVANKAYYGAVYFRRETEPYMTLSVAGTRRDTGVTVAEVNLKHIWDVVNQIHVGQKGSAYVVDSQGRLLAHPDISLVLRQTDLSQLSQVKSARSALKSAADEPPQTALDIRGQRVISAFARADPLNWLVFVELPEAEANAPLYGALTRSVVVLLAGLLLAFLMAVFLARRMAVPIQTLRSGAARIGMGALDHRLAIKTGDELEELGQQFNHMASQLQSSYATLERKVDERTHQLQLANLAKSRFLAAASHDLRQPLHALNLFVAQLRSEADPVERSRVAARIEAAVDNMNALFNALLDVSKLDSGALKPKVSDFPIDSILKHMLTTFAAAAREKGLNLRIVQSSVWVRSDAILLERILLNFLSNAVRYTESGGVVVGCRRRGTKLRIDVCDAGPGIAEDQQHNIFNEFYQLVPKGKEDRDGLGLGLAIVERLGALLDHPIDLESIVGKGSRFSVTVPTVRSLSASPRHVHVETKSPTEALRGKTIVVIDDDMLVLDAMRGLLEQWGCSVLTATSVQEALDGIERRRPDLIISDNHLQDGETGIDAVARLRGAFGCNVPAFLISGDISPERLEEAKAAGHHLLHKPVSPVALRAMVSRLLVSSSRP
jgi:signal transduction histidine kinase/CheY-like chemotaxis protein